MYTYTWGEGGGKEYTCTIHMYISMHVLYIHVCISTCMHVHYADVHIKCTV